MADETEKRDRPPLAFDLAKAIADARAEFPEETKDITFLDMCDKDIRRQLLGWLDATDPVFREKYLASIAARGGDVESWLETCLSTTGFSIQDGISGKTLVVARTALEGENRPLKDVGRTLAYVFAHELGHALVEGGHSPEMSNVTFEWDDAFDRTASVNRAENAADAFAAVYGLRKGWFDPDDIEELAMNAAGAPAVFTRFTHFTTIGLRHIAMDADGANFVSLTPAEVRAVAAQYAREFSLDKDAIRQTDRKISKAISRAYDAAANAKFGDDELSDVEFTHEENIANRLKALADIYRRGLPPSGGNPIPYFVAQTVLAGALKNGKVPGVYDKVDLSGPDWDDVRSLMKQRANETIPSLLDALEQNKRDMLQLKAAKGQGPAPNAPTP